jgi:hypothetical protein
MSKTLKSRNMSGSLHEEREYRVVNVQNIVITMYLSAIQCAMYKGRNYMLCKVILVVGLCCHFSNVCLDLLALLLMNHTQSPCYR